MHTCALRLCFGFRLVSDYRRELSVNPGVVRVMATALRALLVRQVSRLAIGRLALVPRAKLPLGPRTPAWEDSVQRDNRCDKRDGSWGVNLDSRG